LKLQLYHVTTNSTGHCTSKSMNDIQTTEDTTRN